MPHKTLDLEEISRANPNLDLQHLDEWRKLRRTLAEQGVHQRRGCGSYPIQGKRAQIIDDAENDPRLIKLQR